MSTRRPASCSGSSSAGCWQRMTNGGRREPWGTSCMLGGGGPSLGKVCEQDKQSVKATDPDYAGLPYLGLEHVESQTGRLLVDRDQAIQGETKSNNFRFSASHVLYGKLRPYLNKVALPHFAGRCSTEIVPLRPAADVERRWLAWAAQA